MRGINIGRANQKNKNRNNLIEQKEKRNLMIYGARHFLEYVCQAFLLNDTWLKLLVLYSDTMSPTPQY